MSHCIFDTKIHKITSKLGVMLAVSMVSGEISGQLDIVRDKRAVDLSHYPLIPTGALVDVCLAVLVKTYQNPYTKYGYEQIIQST